MHNSPNVKKKTRRQQAIEDRLKRATGLTTTSVKRRLSPDYGGAYNDGAAPDERTRAYIPPEE